MLRAEEETKESRHAAPQDLAVQWEEKEMHINKAGGSPKGQRSDTGQCGGLQHGWKWLGLEGQEVGKYLSTDEWLRGLR